MEISHETYHTISHEFGFSVDALKRHKAKHLTVDLAGVKAAMEQARDEALEQARQKELEEAKTEIKQGMAARLENAASFFDQLKEVRAKAASLLDQAEEAEDLRAAGTFLKELREQIRLWAELEGKLAAQPQITINNNPEWIELRTLILTALDDHPQAKEAVVLAIHGR